VIAYEIDDALAARAAQNLAAYENVAVTHGDAVTAKLPASDVMYVNAGVVAPPVSWVKALKPGGRLVFPWRPDHRIGLAVMVTRTSEGYACEPFMNSWFIPCVGAPMAGHGHKLPNAGAAKRSRSIWLTQDHPPDRSATTIFDDVWFSSRRLTKET
jgi:protein-L-isoaspartate(D-aspartate) O-methyltransferase